MKLLRGFGISARALFAHKVRTALALSSVAVSAAAVVVVSAIGTGAQREIVRQTEIMGTNLLVVRPALVKNPAARKQLRGVVSTLTVEDYEAISELAAVQATVPGFENTLTAKAGNGSMSARVLGTTAAYLEVCRFEVKQGRFFDDDSRQASLVAVLGARVNEELFPGQDAIGQDIRIRGVPVEVIGVLQAKGILADGSDQDNQILIPIRTALRRVFNVTWLNPIFVSVRDPNQMTAAETEIAHLLRARHRLEPGGRTDDFAIQNKSRMLATQKQLADSLTNLALGLAGVSLLVGGIGILALMMMSVKERTSEIGLRMAVGARRADILLQFLAEATLLAAGGWLAGLLLGLLGAAMVAFFARLRVALSPQMVLASLATVLTAGLGFGTWPAWKASIIPPIRALKME
ncbi:MAG TPA: ABC transporter permease [Terracidiphilus sp.]|jgi:putative ABC transport system permease protein